MSWLTRVRTRPGSSAGTGADGVDSLGKVSFIALLNRRLSGRNHPLMMRGYRTPSTSVPPPDTTTSRMSAAPTEAQRVARPLRSDAAANRERILAAATIAVRRDGERVPMATIAAEAGVGIGTLYRHYPTRPDLLAALTLRSFHLVLDHARPAALGDEPVPMALTHFLEQTIAARDRFVLPLHGGPVIRDEKIVALRTEIRDL